MSQEISSRIGKWTPTPVAVMKDASISAQARCLYAILMSYADPANGRWTVWPGIERLSEEIGFSEPRVKQLLHELVGRGLVARQRRIGSSSKTTLLPPMPLYEDSELADEGATEYLTPDSMEAHDEIARSPRELDPDELDPEKASQPTAAPSPTRIPADDLLTPREIQRRDAETIRAQQEEVLGRPRQQKGYYAIGKRLAALWDSQIVEACGVKGVGNRSPGVLVKAAKGFAGLSHTPWRGKPPEEVMELLVVRIKETSDKMRGACCFETIFLKGLNLSNLLNGNWGSQAPALGEDPMERRARKANDRG